jgi:dipeptidase
VAWLQVAMGESTCAARTYAAPIGMGAGSAGKALLEVSELSQIALERTRTARDAILLMGALAEQYGYYSAEYDVGDFGTTDFVLGEGGEALTVVDPHEAWMFHILPDPTGTSAIWAAQLVPAGHITVCANTFVIKEVTEHPAGGQGNLDPKAEFMYSSNMHDIAETQGWWHRATGAPLNFLETFAPQRYRPDYSNLRTWRVFTMFAEPSFAASIPELTDGYATDYPFSVPVDPARLITPRMLMNIQRDHYQNSRFDMTKGLAAGPWGDPTRYDLSTSTADDGSNTTLADLMQGEFPRSIGMFRTSHSFVAVSRGPDVAPAGLALVWLAQYNPDVSSYVPMYVGSDRLPPSWIRGSLHVSTHTRTEPYMPSLHFTAACRFCTCH